MIKFILNNVVTTTEKSEGYRVLDFIRHDLNLTGTKESCREGDCGACLVLQGRLRNNQIYYRSVTSCLMLLGEIADSHIITIEGINENELNPIQQSAVDQNASQCGYCTPGILLSITGYLLTCKDFTYEGIIKALDGNICRCTGYASIKRVAQDLVDYVGDRVDELLNAENRVAKLVEWKLLPGYMTEIKEKLIDLEAALPPIKIMEGQRPVAGGTDLVVQRDEEVEDYDLYFVNRSQSKSKIKLECGKIYIDASATVTDIYESNILKAYFPEIERKFHLISSTPIRNMATLAGNFVNASPIGDLSIFFLVLDAELVLTLDGEESTVLFKDFFINYKIIALQEGELLKGMYIPLPSQNLKMNFEKVSKREHLDIASVNTAMAIETEDNIITKIELAAGGVAAVPKYLPAAGALAIGKTINNKTVYEIAESCVKEVTPISDMRGSAEYKKTLLKNLVIAHFIELFPEFVSAEELV
ncbi:MAG: FAD binding domain-containing protein [Bacteroidetes bacterium]|nr:FAD binding domain-containing protein [Bacteroidota bacterium]